MNAINERRSIRKYKQDTVSNEDIKKIIESGILAPSAKNRQPWKYIVFSGQPKRKSLT
ncbi:nitroreductase family protein [Butyrivibrio sp.]|uniref:nitroreductase family protein n=1 Tax=Butyrivibrio sp. TaxID=28121 RepID=UPI0025BDE999|nr:nitroreductase family protein [Butyrivibrio sp.]